MYISLKASILLLLVSVVHSKKRKAAKLDLDNDVLEKSEVTFTYPTYAIRMPHLVKSRRFYPQDTNTKPTLVSCTSKNVTKALKELRKKIQCVPRDTVVQISAPYSSTITPNTVVVKRCGGLCSGGKKCIASRKKDTEIYVRSIEDVSQMVFCNTVTVSEDVECKCGCKERNKCLSSQKFDTTLCKCICQNKDEQEECLSKSDLNFKWHHKTCSCVCKYEKPCTTGTQWSKEKCRCVKL